jgi:hypothetical protein
LPKEPAEEENLNERKWRDGNTGMINWDRFPYSQKQKRYKLLGEPVASIKKLAVFKYTQSAKRMA